MKFRKKPVVIQAVQWQRHNLDEVLGLVSMSPLKTALSTVEIPTDAVDCLDIKTLEGTMRASPGDWIIKGVKGEFYPCKPDIFAATYDPAD